ncbi:MAG: EAL domain-containing protein [Gammaproteobacteria bacterium]|nr:MAG: EAL domain-containing protein [Gammaproteobacteria bacterium]
MSVADERQEPRRRATRSWGLDSYRGRYFWLSVAVGLLVIALAHWGQQTVRRMSEQSTSLATRQASIINGLIDAERASHQLREALLAYLEQPHATAQSRIERQLKQLDFTLQRLAQQRYPEYPSYGQVVITLRKDTRRLSTLVDRLVHVRRDPDAWVPAGRIMRTQLVPANTVIATGLQNLESAMADPADPTSLRQEILTLRLHWQQIIGELRLLVANRFGIFDIDVQRGMQARKDNIEQRLDAFDRQLRQLPGRLAEADEALLIEEVNDVLDAFSRWKNGYRTLFTLLTRSGWRKDQEILHTRIDPTLDLLQNRLTAMRIRLQADARQQLEHLLSQGERLAKLIGLLAAGILLLLALGYLAFRHWLLRPIHQVTEHLHREARGEKSNQALVIPPIHETRHLTEAFAAMREQVRARERRLDYLAFHDALTGLPNRRLFREKLGDALSGGLTRGRRVAVLFVDLDRFKQVNDAHGHQVGDQLLVGVAQRLRQVFRSEDTVARLSGDEFAVLLGHFGGHNEPLVLARKVLDTLSEPFVIGDRKLYASASVGVSIAPQHGSTVDELIQHADTAMYRAKSAGRSSIAQFQHDMLEERAQSLELERELRTALSEGQLRLHVQPIYDCSGKTLHARECLLRWEHPDKGLLAPGAFLALADEMGLMPQITDWILDQLERRASSDDGSYSVNISSRLLHDPVFIDRLHHRVADGRLEARRLILEITEDTLARELEQTTLQLADLQALGVRIALDDFGTGQSSLSHLRAFPFDLIKIDRSFVAEVEHDEQDANLVRAIISLAHALEMSVVAEGVETESQRRFLTEEGCDYLQGYLLGRPEPLAPDEAGAQASTAG